MKASMFTRPKIDAAMQTFVGGTVQRCGRCHIRCQSEIGSDEVHTVAEPFYVIMAPHEGVVATFPGIMRDPQAYLRRFLRKGDVAAPTAMAAGDLPQFTTIREIPNFNALNQEYSAKGVLVAGVAMDEDPFHCAAISQEAPDGLSSGGRFAGPFAAIFAREATGNAGVREIRQADQSGLTAGCSTTSISRLAIQAAM
jgi:hypothetical protein